MGAFTTEQRDRYIASIAERLFGILTGENPIEYTLSGEESPRSESNSLQGQLDRIEHAVSSESRVNADADSIEGKLAANDEFVATIAARIAEEAAVALSVSELADAFFNRLKERL